MSLSPSEADLPADILVVDDKPDTRGAIAAYMEFEGFSVRESESGARALGMIAEAIPDLVLLDGIMPDIDGLDVLKAIRENPATMDLPVIIVTARGDSSDVALALKRGANDYLIKPVQLEVLVSRVRTLLRLRQLEAQLRAFGDQLKRLRSLTAEVSRLEGPEDARRAADEMHTLITALLGENGQSES